jgi:hypothetical protein
MARGRFISNRIMLDRHINELSSDTCRLAFTWLITLADREGRMFGEPDILLAHLFPRRTDITADMIEQFIYEWADAGFITLYLGSDGDRYIQFVNFERHQHGLRKDREAPSSFDDPASCEIVAGPRIEPDPTLTYTNNQIESNEEIGDISNMNNSEIKFTVKRLLGDNYNLHDACLMGYNIKKSKSSKSNSAFAGMISDFERAGVTLGDYLDAIDEYDRDGRYPGNAATTYSKWTLNKVKKEKSKTGSVRDQSPDAYRKSWGSKQ